MYVENYSVNEWKGFPPGSLKKHGVVEVQKDRAYSSHQYSGKTFLCYSVSKSVSSHLVCLSVPSMYKHSSHWYGLIL